MDDKSIHLKEVFIGGETEKLARKIPNNDTMLQSFSDKAHTAFLKCAQYYMQGVLPLNNRTLKALACIDPIARSHSVVKKGLADLASCEERVGLGSHLSSDGQTQVSHE